jgi:predicted CopG family antitoxin
MSSINISITEDVYEMLKRLKKKDESFSEIIRSLVKQKDISRCYGLWKGDEKNIQIIKEEAARARKQRWREVSI